MPSPNYAPYEVLAGPGDIYLAAVGAAFPLVDDPPDATDWALIGTSGNLNTTRDGITISHKAKYEEFRADGDSGVRKMFLLDEDQEITLEIKDISPEQYRIAINSNTVTDTPAGAGTPGVRTMGLSRSDSQPQQFSLLIRVPSPLMQDGVAQYEIPVAVQIGEPEVIIKRGTPAGIKLMFKTLVDQDATSPYERFGRFVAQDAPAA